jgi:hypothetical protein
LEYDAVWPVGSQPTFRKKKVSTFWVKQAKKENSVKQAAGNVLPKRRLTFDGLNGIIVL